MGRKIPGKKHRGVRDPEKQRELRLQSLKGKINAPPVNPDVQEIPRSLNRLIALKKKSSEQRKPKKKRNQFNIEREKGESERDYLSRVESICDDIIEENRHLDFTRNDKTGEIENFTERDEDEAVNNRKRKRDGKLKKLEEELLKPKVTKSQKRKMKRLQKQQERESRDEVDFASKKDNIKFGEIVHAPPNLVKPRYASKEGGAARPGRKNLLLKTIVDDKNDRSKTIDKKGTASKVIDKKGKRKNLPNALRRKMEKQQTEIINAYRMLKSKRQKGD
ncbi:hypothetical protein PPYR_13461 [Photinus pyralis]|uniref:Coiled-coil domain-containing protein 137 n=1 Tax=Photinus pyralis TaxID=7054 RepID=A0A1Y1M9F0_PHOPY|nr:coiled-coil domain-containing protein 137 [Photinus pyralis]KAB0793841.1 hypothetical protein PPYR_13461 [Photinus pyralis]